VSSETNENDQGGQAILYWGLALVGLIAIKQLWTERLRPWIESTWGQLRAGELVDLPVVGRVDQVDVIEIVVRAVPLLVALVVVVGKVKRRKRFKTTAARPAE
jgi:hypothetical protein